MNRSCKAVFLMIGLALPGAGARAVERSVPWERIDVGLARLADGDGRGAAAAFQKARRADGSGLAELLMDKQRLRVRPKVTDS